MAKYFKYIELLDFRKKNYYSFEHFKESYNLGHNTFLKFYQIISSIDPNLKQNLKDENILYTPVKTLVYRDSKTPNNKPKAFNSVFIYERFKKLIHFPSFFTLTFLLFFIYERFKKAVT
jgi:hypothetical protein